MSSAAGGGTAPSTKGAPRAQRPRRGDMLELRIESVAHGGAGVGRMERYVVFVDGGFPGELVRAEVLRSKRDYANARAVEVLEPSPDRVPQRCDHGGQPCPGSPWQELRYERQLELKQELVGDALQRIGHLDGFELEPIVPAGEPWRYRNKMEYSFGTSEDGSLALGFHRRGRWDVVDDARDCMLAPERSNAVRNLVRDWCAQRGLDAMDRRTREGFLRNLVVREGRRTGELQVRLVTADGQLEHEELTQAVLAAHPGADVAWTRTDRLAEVTQGGETEVLAGSAVLHEELCDLRFRISPEAFFQTNTETAEVLYGLARDYAQLAGHERVYDLYCGIGTLSLTLALRAGQVWGLDLVHEAIADAIENARLNEIDNVHFFAGDVRDALRPLAERAPRPDVAVVDPPRAGLSQKVVRRLLETNPGRIVYVSCNPTTLAPNAHQMVDAGYRLVKVRPVDMFPHTPHIECVALLERERGAGG
ncbi:MAG: 23S rRNA (uracil(1939)-C(5))-methyltransferase RlmD [Solirubrobacterales bacterium]